MIRILSCVAISITVAFMCFSCSSEHEDTEKPKPTTKSTQTPSEAALAKQRQLESSARAPEPEQTASREPLSPEAQSAFDRLNAQCASEPWQREIDMIERPETRPENYNISGEATAFVAECKERLAKQGVHVKWNPSKKLYEVEKIEEADVFDKQ